MCYGGRGIKVCKTWKDNPQSFITWCLSNGYNKKLQLDRKNNDGDYKPSNCRFITKIKNSQNRRTTKLKESDVKEIRSSNLLNKDLAKIYNTSRVNISLIHNNKTWKNIK